MKKVISVALLVSMLCAFLIGCSSNQSAGETTSPATTEAAATPAMEIPAKEPSAPTVLDLNPDEKAGYETFVTKLALPKDKKQASNQPGTVIEIFYTTHAYALEEKTGEEIVVEKSALVYLPYGYDENKSYDILYLMHGGGESQYYWLGNESMLQEGQKAFGDRTRNVLDNLMARGESVEAIVVTPSFYTNAEGYETTYVDATTVCLEFAHELRNDLIPAIESQYSTFAGKEVSEESLRRSRDHRAFAGFSMGSFTTIQGVMMENLDLFSYFGAFSGSLTSCSVFKAVLESDAYRVLPIRYMYNGNGTNDIAHDEHKAFCLEILETMPDRFTDGVNFAWVDYDGGYHTYNSWITDLYNCMTVFFK